MVNTPAKSVLIVEDDADALRNLADILDLDGYAVHSAATFAEALQFRKFDDLLAIILDRRLPDGLADELLPRLRQRAPETPVIIVTGFVDLEGAIAALRQGAADYILKPIDADSLRVRLKRLVENRQIKQELKEAQRRALQSERLAAIGQMMTGLAHESRNALQRSQACLEMLRLEVHDHPQAIGLVERIQQAQDYLHQLYEEVRDYAAPIRLKREVHDVVAVLWQTWEHLAALRLDRDARLIVDSGGTHSVGRVDRQALEQVFRNILENALASCGDPVEILVRLSDARLGDRSALRISICDDGPGLTPESRLKIFEPFYTTRTRGTGLGMAITRRLVEAHGGSIAIGDHPAPGAEIVVTIPLDDQQEVMT